MTARTPRTGPIVWRMHLASSPRTVFDLLATPRGRASFWAEDAPERDGAIHFRFIDGTETASRIVEARPHSTFAIEYFGGIASFQLQSDGRGGTDLTLTHEGLPDDAWLETYAGWANVLFPLKARADHGVELRNRDPSRTWADGYLDQ